MKNNGKLIEGFDYWTAIGLRLAEHMDYSQGTKVLDVGTGWGACILPAAKKIGPKGQAIGIDLWENSIQETMDNAKAQGLTNVTAEIMNARTISFDDNFFDYVICGFIGFDREYDFCNNTYRTDNSIMENFYRVLKPQGKVGLSTWSKQGELDCLRELIKNYLEKHTSVSALEIENVPISYSQESTEGIEKIMRDAGFQKIHIITENFVMKYHSVDEWFNMMRNVGWIMWRTFNKDETTISDFKEKMLPEGLEPYWKEDGYYFTKTVIFAFGYK
ncbi:MAG: methyltransferase domain-containing protein [Asgard group archaeon]|nr:methyltransferase domain-containing protein [Asgard group archaeon]